VVNGEDGSLVWSFAADPGYPIENAPIVADFDNDDWVDIFCIGGRGYSDTIPNYGRAYAIKAGAVIGDTWTMYRHDVYRSGYQFGGPMTEANYEYLPGDVNMYNGLWPPNVIGSDVTYLVNYFRGISVNQPCLIVNFWCSTDANGDCIVMGSDVIRLVAYFRGAGEIEYCADYPPSWPTSGDLPPSMPSGWPNCETPPVTGKIVSTGDIE